MRSAKSRPVSSRLPATPGCAATERGKGQPDPFEARFERDQRRRTGVVPSPPRIAETPDRPPAPLNQRPAGNRNRFPDPKQASTPKGVVAQRFCVSQRCSSAPGGLHRFTFSRAPTTGRYMQHRVMATPHEDPFVTRRVRTYRQRMRARGMRPIQMWVADVRAPGFAAEAHRQSAAVADSDHAADDQAFIDAVSLDEARDAPRSGRLPQVAATPASRARW